MDHKKLINFSEVSLVLTGTRNTVRANRPNPNYAVPLAELVDFLDGWVAKNGIKKEAKVKIKSK